MLVLSRREGESIKIGNDVTVMICSIRGDKVRIGIDAPKNVVVNRQEIAEKLQKKGGKDGNGEDHVERAEGDA